MRDIITVTKVLALDERRLRLWFSDGRCGIRDCSDILAQGGPMVEALHSRDIFSRVFVQMGVPTWPNGYELDAMQLYAEMANSGALAVASTLTAAK